MDDAPTDPPTDPAEQRPTLRGQVRWFVAALAAVAILGLASGWLYAKGQPAAAAGALVADFVVEEFGDGDDRVPQAPSTGVTADGVGTVRCGVLAQLTTPDHVASLAAGVVVVRHRDLDAGEAAVLEDLARRHAVLVAPADDLPDRVHAVAWGRRMPLDTANRELLAAFHTAFVDAVHPNDVPLPPTCNGA